MTEFAKTEAVTTLYSPLHSKVESGVETAALAGSASNISLKEQLSEGELSQDARSLAEHFVMRSFCLSLVRTRRFALAFLITLWVIVGICVATIFALQGKPSDLLCFT